MNKLHLYLANLDHNFGLIRKQLSSNTAIFGVVKAWAYGSDMIKIAKRLERLGVDYIYANELDVAKGVVTGKVIGEIIDGQRKSEIVVEIANQLGLSLEQVITVGDGANDLPMLNIAGLGIAFRAKPLVKASAKQAISNVGLDGILYLLGYSDKDIVNLHKDTVV